MSEQVVGIGDGLAVDRDHVAVQATAFEHGELLRPFAPSQEVIDDPAMFDAYIAAFNKGLEAARTHIVSVIAKNRELEKGQATGGTVSETSHPPIEQEIQEAHDFGRPSMPHENSLRERYGLPKLTEAQFTARSARISAHLAQRTKAREEQERKINKMIGV